jgi:hypothetical protein
MRPRARRRSVGLGEAYTAPSTSAAAGPTPLTNPVTRAPVEPRRQDQQPGNPTVEVSGDDEGSAEAKSKHRGEEAVDRPEQTRPSRRSRIRRFGTAFHIRTLPASRNLGASPTGGPATTSVVPHSSDGATAARPHLTSAGQLDSVYLAERPLSPPQLRASLSVLMGGGKVHKIRKPVVATLLAVIALGLFLETRRGDAGKITRQNVQAGLSVSWTADPATLQRDLRTAIASMETYHADNGSYTGATVVELRQIDPGLAEDVSIGAAAGDDYCIQAGEGAESWSFNRAGHTIVAGACG